MKTVLLTGATDGIGKRTAKRLVQDGHRVLLHGRSASKLAAVADALGGDTATYTADLSRLAEVRDLVAAVRRDHDRLDVLINNAGVYRTPDPLTAEGLDVRFVVNTVAPYVLTVGLLPLLGTAGRVVNVSSAAQAPVSLEALAGRARLAPMDAYAQSKLAIAAWTQTLAADHPDGPVFVAVNPGSLLATKMVREGFGVAGSDVGIGVEVLVRAALDPTWAARSGSYYDNDTHRFAPVHPAGQGRRARAITRAVEEVAGAAS